jgi:hypothetical protein
MNSSSNQDVAPGDLLATFNGRSLKTIVIFTLIVHAVLLLATSGGYLWRAVSGSDTSNLSESERLDLAVKETTAAMRRIAEQHGVKPQDLGGHFAAPASARPAETPKPATAAAPTGAPASAPVTAPTPAPAPAPATEEPKSSIEKEIQKAVPGPAVPADEDLFK